MRENPVEVNPVRPVIFELRLDVPCPDLCQAPWDAWEESTPAEVHRIEVGRRWTNAGHPEWNHKVVHHRLRFHVPESLRGRNISFYCTWADDQAEVRINGRFSAERRFLAYLPTAPLIADLSSSIKWGEENELLVIVRDSDNTRTGGMVGSVRLSHSLPYTLTPAGGVTLAAKTPDRFHLLLHLAAARLTLGGRDAFTAAELSALRLPPGILRADELLLPVPAGSVDSSALLPLEMNHVHPGCDQRGLALGVSPVPAEIGRYELLEWSLDLKATYRNPYNTEEVSVTCLVTCPSGRIESIGAFFAQPFVSRPVGQEEEILLPTGGSPWKLRYRPREIGTYHFEFLAHDASGTLLVAAPPCVCNENAGHRGYLRISPDNPRMFAYDDGTPFFATGPGGWFRSSEFIFGGSTRWVSTALLDAYYARKAAAGCTYEYTGTFHFGVTMLPNGHVDPHIMWKLDHAVRSMEQYGLKWLVFSDDLRRHLDADGMEGHPYWHANGGAARCLEDFYSHPAVLKLQERRLAHMISRFADSPAIWIWNCGDESECQPGMKISKTMVQQWLKHLHQFIRNHDVYGHAHAIGECRDAVHLGSDVVVLEDWYYDFAWPSQSSDHVWLYENRKDDVRANDGLLSRYQDLPCPVINSEGGHGLVGFVADPPHGNNGTLTNSTTDRYSDASFHIHLWISLFKQCAAGGTNWLCNAMDRERQLYHAGAIGRFIAQEPLARGKWTSAAPEKIDPRLYGFTLSAQFEDRLFLWVTDRNYSLHQMILSGGAIQPVTGANTSVKMPEGNWAIEWWDTFSGKPITTETVDVKAASADGMTEVEIHLPTFTKDIAAKLVRTNRR